MGVVEIEKETEEVLKRDESKLIRALELYYSNFTGGDKDLTFNEAAHKAGINPAYLVDYILYCPSYIGVPDTREEAQTFLQNLRAYKKSL